MKPSRSICSLAIFTLLAACQSRPNETPQASSNVQSKAIAPNEAPPPPPTPTVYTTPTLTPEPSPTDALAVASGAGDAGAYQQQPGATGGAKADAKPNASPDPAKKAPKEQEYGGADKDSTLNPFMKKKTESKGVGAGGYAPPRATTPAPTPKPIGPTTPPVGIPPVPPPVIPPVAEKKPDYANANAFYQNTYQGGAGGRDRIEDLIANGVMIDGKSIPLDALAADYRQPFPLPFDRALSLEAATEHRALEAKGGRTVLQVGLQGMQTESPRRPPLRLSLVVDVSGSMKKEDRMIKVKDAVAKLVDKLTKDDQISIVAFESTAKVLCQMGPASRPEVKQAIEDMTPGGGTNIFDGLQYGYSQMGLLPKNDDGFKVVLLFSDGEVTAGEQDPMKFDELTRSAFASKIATTTFGVGLSFNEKLMMDISQSGKGSYHFLKDAIAADRAINSELEDYTHVVASDVLVRVKLASGVKLVRVFGAQELDEAQKAKVKADEEMLDDRAKKELGIAEDRSKDDEEGIKTLIPQFYLGDSHVILMEVELPAGTGTRPVADVFLKYKDLIFTRNGEEKDTISVETAPDANAQVRSLDSSVKKNILGYETGEVLVKAAELIRAGQTLEAARKLEEQRELLSNASARWVDDDLRKDSELVGKYQEVVASLGNRNLANTEEGEALAKAFAYSGYQLKK